MGRIFREAGQITRHAHPELFWRNAQEKADRENGRLAEFRAQISLLQEPRRVARRTVISEFKKINHERPDGRAPPNGHPASDNP